MDQPMTDACRRAGKIRRFSLTVSLALMVLCNAILLAGLRLSGINLDDLVKTPISSTPNRTCAFDSRGSHCPERMNRFDSVRNGFISPTRVGRPIISSPIRSSRRGLTAGTMSIKVFRLTIGY